MNCSFVAWTLMQSMWTLGKYDTYMSLLGISYINEDLVSLNHIAVHSTAESL